MSILLLILILKGKGDDKEIIFSIWPSGKVIKTEEDHVSTKGTIQILQLSIRQFIYEIRIC